MPESNTKIALGPGRETHGKELMCADICFFAFGFCVCATLGGAQGLQPTLYPRIVLDGAQETLRCQVSNLGLPYANHVYQFFEPSFGPQHFCLDPGSHELKACFVITDYSIKICCTCFFECLLYFTKLKKSDMEIRTIQASSSLEMADKFGRLNACFQNHTNMMVKESLKMHKPQRQNEWK